jgi:hypothetical protein
MAAPISTSVSTTAVVVATPFPGGNFEIFNAGQATAYISNNASVTTTTAFPLTPGSYVRWFQPYNYTTSAIPATAYAICASGTGTVINVQGISI